MRKRKAIVRKNLELDFDLVEKVDGLKLKDDHGNKLSFTAKTEEGLKLLLQKK